MADWNAKLYLKFEDERTRPSADLLAQVAPAEARCVVDLGCGPGNSTELLAARFPEANVIGVDTSPDMLEKARQRLPRATFIEADVATWRPEQPVDVLFANAVLQWLPNHDELFPHLMTLLAPGGILAVQMPNNLTEPSHALMRDVAREERWRDKLAKASAARVPLAPPGHLYDLVKPSARRVDIWQTTYQHPLDGPAAIIEWLKATGLRPFLAPLNEAEQAAFLADYRERLTEGYPPRVDGKVLLAFPRLFIVAEKAA
ncbi:trans-aconitate 2-methyltransferase [Chelatococcus asaccharovorans]|uniref:Trans-aconitate 2-methyltransferase n=1 Tax=Chelatococcus asaccharovorans TaxID=28210 RepID=A0A2V3U1X1_9HYPH|nr:trans-aconitate 2-methyltransferase [Chelatococcus asaccharovorans]MBS7704331.1 trans-aconitate 2-methyltransferase [Chelatococcus asaccharovorans]PXW55792.1 trans-aconitate 2-methyltransferase [Chelatococcus asaccharovorans]